LEAASILILCGSSPGGASHTRNAHVTLIPCEFHLP